MRSRSCSGSGWPAGEAEASGRRVTSKAPNIKGPRGRRVRPLRGVAHSHPPGYSQRGRGFCELPLYGVLRSSLIALRQKYATWQMRQHKLSLECLLVKAVRGLELRLEDGRALGT